MGRKIFEENHKKFNASIFQKIINYVNEKGKKTEGTTQDGGKLVNFTKI